MTDDPSVNSAATVERAADVLLLFADSPSPRLGVTEIANALGISKSAVHRILLSFKNKNLLELDPVTRKYVLGPTVLDLSSKYLGTLDIRRLASDELGRLSRVTNETATLSVRSSAGRVYVEQVTPDREVIMRVQLGVVYPLHAGASSKALLAFLPQAEIEAYLGGALASVTDYTVTDPALLRRELNVIRQCGWARSAGERQQGSASVAAPVLDAAGQPVAVISVCGPAERFGDEAGECVKHLVAGTRALSARLGYRAAAMGSSAAAAVRPPEKSER